MQDSRPVCRFGLLHFLLAVAAFSAAGGLFRVSQQMQLAAPNFSALALFAAAALFGGAVASVLTQLAARRRALSVGLPGAGCGRVALRQGTLRPILTIIELRNYRAGSSLLYSPRRDA